MPNLHGPYARPPVLEGEQLQAEIPGVITPVGREAYIGEKLLANGVELGAFDRLMVKWVARYELTHTMAVTRWVTQAYLAGQIQGQNELRSAS